MVQPTVTDITYEFSTSRAWFKDLYKVNKLRQSAALLLDVVQFPHLLKLRCCLFSYFVASSKVAEMARRS